MCVLDVWVEDCVNVVGVEVNMVLAVLFLWVFGLFFIVVENIVCYCDDNGLFKCCKDLFKVLCLGDKIFE